MLNLFQHLFTKSRHVEFQHGGFVLYTQFTFQISCNFCSNISL